MHVIGELFQPPNVDASNAGFQRDDVVTNVVQLGIENPFPFPFDTVFYDRHYEPRKKV